MHMHTYLALADGLDNEVAVRQRLLELHDAHHDGLALEGPLLQVDGEAWVGLIGGIGWVMGRQGSLAFFPLAFYSPLPFQDPTYMHQSVPAHIIYNRQAYPPTHPPS